MDPDDVIELMWNALERYENVRAAMRYHVEGPLVTQAEVEASLMSDHPETYEKPDFAGSFSYRCRVWYTDNVYWRRELNLPDGGVDITASPDQSAVGWRDRAQARIPQPWNRRIGGGQTEDDSLRIWVAARDSYWTHYPFEPDIAGIPPTFWHRQTSVESGLEYAGREMVRLVSLAEEEHEVDEPLRTGADRYELLVDTERGIILRATSMLRGEEIDSLEVEEVFFDEHFPEEVFTSPQPLP